MNTITKSTLVDFINESAELMNKNKDFLIELDAALGDGDLGLTMSAGFGKAKEFAETAADTDLGKLLMRIGMVFAQTVPSTMGTLIASGFMKSAKEIMGKTELDASAMADFAKGFVNGIMERGKAKPGDRTIVDSIYPAYEALSEASKACIPLSEACKLAYEAAEKGVESTKNMMPAFGRAAYFGEKAIGRPDQGAVVGMLVYKALYTAVLK